MSPKVRVSRHGLTTCPGCRAHIRLAAEVRQTVCIFCGTELIPSSVIQSAMRTVADVVRYGRGGLIAASLLGASVLPGCDEDPNTGAVDAGAEAQPVYGVPADVMDDADVMNDSSADAQNDFGAPLYGLPADMIQDVQIDVAPDPGPQPEYGVPPDAFPTDAQDTVDADVDDVPVLPPYGIPPDAFPD